MCRFGGQPTIGHEQHSDGARQIYARDEGQPTDGAVADGGHDLAVLPRRADQVLQLLVVGEVHCERAHIFNA